MVIVTCGQLVDNDVTRAKNIGWNPRATGYDAGSLGLDDREYLLGTAVESADVARGARGESPEVKPPNRRQGLSFACLETPTTRATRMPEQMMNR